MLKSFQYCPNIVLVSCLLFSSSVFSKENTQEQTEVAIFAGGCFWCMEQAFDTIPGVLKTIAGYTGGKTENPTYGAVSNGKTGHLEAVEVTYDPTKVNYEKLLDVFWHNIDPFDNEGQFCDKGNQYKASIFYLDQRQKQLADASTIMIEQRLLDKNIVTSIMAAGKFYPAEESHQDYYLKNPTKYKFFRFTCGRDRRLEKIWGK